LLYYVKAHYCNIQEGYVTYPVTVSEIISISTDA
jgi:hypothetical protein